MTDVEAPRRTGSCLRWMSSRSIRPFIVVVSVWLASGLTIRADELTKQEIRFARDVRPILAENCFRCHGPDAERRQADLRLDLETTARQRHDDRAAVVPGNLAESQLWVRINATSDDERMPPPDSGNPLTADQIEIVRQWLEQGAKWEQHWSFAAPRRPALPVIQNWQPARNAIDYFIAARLESAGLAPSPPADKEVLLRRVTLDLTGLPPTLDERESFLADDSPNAYEKVVERLLASARFGERMAWLWLESARYADTSGYQNDGPRSMWRWRDWVIAAFNQGIPFDQFTLEQLAGDLLPGATLEQQIATGFNRNHRGNSEGGIIPEEYQVEYVVDRVDTTATVWLGLTMGCARCHDHKFDPISQREFYRIYAYFNNIPEYGRATKEGNSPPYIVAPTREQLRQRAELDARLAEAQRRWEQLAPALAASQQVWEEKRPAIEEERDWEPEGCSNRYSFEPSAPAHESPWKLVDDLPRFVAGRIGQAIQLDGQHVVDAGDAGGFGYFDSFSVSLWVKPLAPPSGILVSKMTDEEQGEGWYVQLRDGRVQVNLVKRWLDDAIRVESERPLIQGDNSWTHLSITYDGSRQARGIQVYADGIPIPLSTKLDFLNQTFATKEPLRMGGGGGPTGRFQGSIDELKVFSRVVTPQEAQQLATAETVAEIVGIPPDRRSVGQRLKLESYFLGQVAAVELKHGYQSLQAERKNRDTFIKNLPTVMVMSEKGSPPRAHVLTRGEYNRPADVVEPGVPGCLPPLPENAPANRLGFAVWLVSPDNPLTARVAVNRMWQMLFGAGLVRTTEDFGVQGELPSHPEMLDWLADEFQSAGWDLKQLLRSIVSSATYRQTSSLESAEPASAMDADNRLLARAPRFRLSAEMLRDQALAASGLLVEQVGGPSVKPYQPADLWKDLATDSVYEQDHGDKLYRRSLYTYWKRTVAPPSMTAFDASGREACQVRTPRTNTPMQALTLLNEVTYVEAARALAQELLRYPEQSDARRLETVFQQLTCRRPTERELARLLSGLQLYREHFRQQPEGAVGLIETGEYERPPELDAVELAAWTMVCNLLLNLDEVVTRQ